MSDANVSHLSLLDFVLQMVTQGHFTVNNLHEHAQIIRNWRMAPSRRLPWTRTRSYGEPTPPNSPDGSTRTRKSRRELARAEQDNQNFKGRSKQVVE